MEGRFFAHYVLPRTIANVCLPVRPYRKNTKRNWQIMLMSLPSLGSLADAGERLVSGKEKSLIENVGCSKNRTTLTL